jgi:predicted Rdx family selenoprotein
VRLARAGTAFDIRDRARRGGARAGTGGVFEITYDGGTIWERKADGGFPDAKIFKRRLRTGRQVAISATSTETARTKTRSEMVVKETPCPSS